MARIVFAFLSTAIFSAVALGQAPAPAPAGLIVGVGNFSHIVADTDRSIAFYRDVIGLEAPASAQAFSGNAAIMALGNTPGAQSKATTVRVPGAQIGLEIIEYKDIDRKPAQLRFQDPGAATLILTVRDVDAIAARAKKAGAHINTAGGVPATIQGGKAMFVQDPDGFFVELSQRAATTDTPAGGSNILGGAVELIVQDIDKSMPLYKALGFSFSAPTALDGSKLLMDTVGTPGARFRRTVATIPGTTTTMAFLEFKDIDRKPQHTRTQDPGTPILQLRTRDVDGVMKAWKSAGGEVVSTGGEPVSMGATKIVLLRDPVNNMQVEILTAPQAKQ